MKKIALIILILVVSVNGYSADRQLYHSGVATAGIKIGSGSATTSKIRAASNVLQGSNNSGAAWVNLIPTGPIYRTSTYSNNIVTAVAAASGTLIVDSPPDTLTADLTIPSTVPLHFMKGCGLTISSGAALTVECSVSAYEYPFTTTNSGSVVFSNYTADPATQAPYRYFTGIAAQALLPTGAIDANYASTNLGKGFQSIAINDAGEIITTGGIIGKLYDDANGDEKADQYIAVVNGGTEYAAVKIDHHGTFLIAPIIGGYSDQPAKLDALESAFGGRISILDADGGGGTHIAELRNYAKDSEITATGNDAASTSFRSKNYTGIAFGMHNTADEEIELGSIVMRTGLAVASGTNGEIYDRTKGRTDGAERTIFAIKPARGSSGTTPLLDEMHIEGDPDNAGTYIEPWMSRYKYKTYATGNAHLTISDGRFCAAIISNNGAKVNGREITLPRGTQIGNGWPVTLRTGATPLGIDKYRWIASGGTNEYFVELSGGGNAGFSEPETVYEAYTTRLAEGTRGALNAGEWDYDRSTIFVRLTSEGDPDAYSGEVMASYKIRATTLTASGGIVYPASGVTTTIYSDGVMGSSAEFVYDKQLRVWFMGETVGTWATN